MIQSKKFGDRAVSGVSLTVVTVMMALCALPILHIIALSLSDKSVAMAGMVSFWPIKPTAAAYSMILTDQRFLRSFLNSVERVLLGGSINMFFVITMGYPLSRSKRYFPQRNLYIWLLLFTMLFSGGIVPLYLVVYRLGLLDSIWSLVLPCAVPAYNIILLMNYFRNLPEEINEAARIDGAGAWRIMLQINVPLAIPCLATIALFTVVGHWNAFFDGAIYINTVSKLLLQTYIQQLVIDMRSTNLTLYERQLMDSVSGKSFNAAKVLVAMFPLLAIYPFMQKFFVKGIVLGSVKG